MVASRNIRIPGISGACPAPFRYNFSVFRHIYSGRRRYRKKNPPSNPTIDPALPCPRKVITTFPAGGICSRPSRRMAPGSGGSAAGPD